MSQPTTAPSDTDVHTATLEVPGAVLTYDVRPGTGDDVPLFLFASPMPAAGLAALAAHVGDRTVITYDPRGSARSTRPDPTAPSTPDDHAGDLHRIIAAVTDGPVDVFASSGGAVNALALVTAHPEQVRTLVAHEPPLARMLPDRDAALAACTAVADAYQQDGFGAGMARFITLVMRRGPIGADVFDPAPDPAAFGLPTTDDGSRDDVLLGQNLRAGTAYQPDLAALRAAATRIVVAVGAESEGEFAARAGVALAELLGVPVVTVPSHHVGFSEGGGGAPAGDPPAFAAALRTVLAG
ncbi:alpha/beta fold hydrolase [Nakamurella leprariae]|uniref:Alpha/beta fold hydrolase n=1 Tax=Nakamurella leprariae TaxID=2803911 RepID=A0A939BWM2_9ACTN|nr:alpha/beta fold hydrolase [Nakamurella leprariae]MBM9467693.1 alpha/beta fold hydrolase [Nakamurella leprariae]